MLAKGVPSFLTVTHNAKRAFRMISALELITSQEFLSTLPLPRPSWLRILIELYVFGGLLIGLGIFLFDAAIYARGFALMRSQMYRCKWAALILSITPCLISPMWQFVSSYLPPFLSGFAPISLILLVGWPCCIALAACWLRLPKHLVDEPRPCRRPLVGEWLLGLALLTVNYLASIVISGGWRSFY